MSGMDGANQIKRGSEGPLWAKGEDPKELCGSVHIPLQWGTYCHSYPNPSMSDTSLKNNVYFLPSSQLQITAENPDAGEGDQPREQEAIPRPTGQVKQMVTKGKTGSSAPETR